jgi:DNA-binding transcriptional LysR family regulator
MKLRSLEAFCAAVEEKSISAAARRMYLSQPSVSEKLIELEREAQVPLLKRSRHSLELTPEGVTIYEQARKVLNEVKALELTLRSLRSKDDRSYALQLA